MPTQSVEAAAVHELAWGPIRPCGIEGDLAGVTDGFADGFGQILDGDVLAAAHINVAESGLGVLVVEGFVEIHNVYAGSGHVVYVEKFPLWRAGAPDGDSRGAAHFGFVESAE